MILPGSVLSAILFNWPPQYLSVPETPSASCGRDLISRKAMVQVPVPSLALALASSFHPSGVLEVCDTEKPQKPLKKGPNILL